MKLIALEIVQTALKQASLVLKQADLNTGRQKSPEQTHPLSLCPSAGFRTEVLLFSPHTSKEKARAIGKHYERCYQCLSSLF